MNRFLTLIFALTTIGACAQKMEKYTLLTPSQFEKAITDSTVQLLDVRMPDEYATGHLPRAVNIDVKGSDFAGKVRQTLDITRPVALCCRSGMRSASASKLLSELGFTIIDMKGGILAWTGKTTK